MRSILVTLLIVGSLPLIVVKPHVGVLVWSWIGYMNPHRLTWGFAYDFPFVLVAALLTLVSMPFSKQPKRMPWSRLTVIWLLWVAWMCITTLFALNPADAIPEWERTMKIQLMVLATLLLMGEREHIHRLVWVIALSIGFFGIKGGLFTILHGGSYLVMGPPGSHIAGNNEIALALLTHSGVALARVLLGPVLRNIQASWVKEGPKLAQALLDAGANDLGGTLINESISTSAGAQYGQLVGPAELRRWIREAGRVPALRDTVYNVVRTYEAGDEPASPLDAVEDVEARFGSYRRLIASGEFRFTQR